jgi:hypothetical protein
MQFATSLLQSRAIELSQRARADDGIALLHALNLAELSSFFYVFAGVC